MDAALSRSDFEVIFSLLNVGIITTDAGNNTLFVNKEAEKILELKAESLLYKNLYNFVTFEQSSFINNHRQSFTIFPVTFSTFSTVTVNESGVHSPNSKLRKMTCFVIASPIQLSGDMTGYMFLLQKPRNNEEKESQATNFISVAAHQLRTPMGSSRWLIEMVLNGDYGEIAPELKDVFGQLYETNKRLLDLVNNLLDTSRIDQHRVQDTPTDVDLIKVINDSLAELAPQIKMRALKVVFENFAHGLPNVLIDAKRLRDVIDNLLSNAIKYNRQNGYLRVEVRVIDQFIQLVVMDNGRGIPAKDQGKIFSKFFRAENAVLSDTEGSGLGLFMVKSYVEAWGGKIWFQSLENIGTQFFIHLPLKPKAHTLEENLVAQPHQTEASIALASAAVGQVNNQPPTSGMMGKI